MLQPRRKTVADRSASSSEFVKGTVTRLIHLSGEDVRCHYCADLPHIFATPDLVLDTSNHCFVTTILNNVLVAVAEPFGK